MIAEKTVTVKLLVGFSSGFEKVDISSAEFKKYFLKYKKKRDATDFGTDLIRFGVDSDIKFKEVRQVGVPTYKMMYKQPIISTTFRIQYVGNFNESVISDILVLRDISDSDGWGESQIGFLGDIPAYTYGITWKGKLYQPRQL